MEQDFHGDFQVNVTWFFACFSGVLDWIVLILVWFERSLHSAQVSEESCPWPLKLMTSQRVERTWICTGGSGANGLIKKPKNGLLPTFSPDFTWNRQIWLFYAEKWIFSKILVLCLRGAFIGRVIFPINKMCGASFEGHCLFLCLFACFFFFLQRELFLVFGAFQPSKSSII